MAFFHLQKVADNLTMEICVVWADSKADTANKRDGREYRTVYQHELQLRISHHRVTKRFQVQETG